MARTWTRRVVAELLYDVTDPATHVGTVFAASHRCAEALLQRVEARFEGDGGQPGVTGGGGEGGGHAEVVVEQPVRPGVGIGRRSDVGRQLGEPGPARAQLVLPVGAGGPLD